jgi:hypothetical protein
MFIIPRLKHVFENDIDDVKILLRLFEDNVKLVLYFE